MRKISKRGFTLVEIMLVIAMIVALVAVTAIAASKYLGMAQEANDEAVTVAPKLSNMFQNERNSD